MIACRDVGHHPASHAMPGNGYVIRIDAQGCGLRGIAQEGEHGVGILQVLCKAEIPGAAPGAAIVKRHRVPAAEPDGWYKRPSTETPWLGMSSTVMAAGCSRSGGESLEISA